MNGTTLRELIYELGGGIPDGRELKAIIPGGSSTPVLTADQVDTALDYDSLAQAGTMFGSGAIVVIDDRCCMVQLGLRVAQFYMHESCGKCTPCREGTRWMVQILHAIEEGSAAQGELDLLLDVCDRILGKCLCPLGDAAAMPVASYVNKFRAEFQGHIDHGGCPFGGESSLEGLLAPVDQHAHPRVEVTRVSAPELVTVTIDEREVQVPKGTGSSRRRRRGHRDPGVLLRAAARAAGRRLPHVPRRGRGHAEAAGRLHPHRAGRDDREDGAHLGQGGRGPGRDARVHPRQPPARLPGLRQGRRVPAAGPDLPLRARVDADDLPKRTFEKPIPISPRSRSTASAASSATAARASREGGRARTGSSSRATAAPTR